MAKRGLTRRAFVRLAALTGVGVLAACQPATSVVQDEGDSAAPGQAVTQLTMWDFPNTENEQELVWDPLLEKLGEEHPELQVTVDVLPWTGRREKLYTAVAAGTPPDTWLASSDTLPAYAEKNVAASQTSFLPSEIMDDFSVWEKQLTTYNGEIQFMIMHKNVIGFAYNGNLLDEIGWDRGTPIETWDQFLAVGELAKEKGYYATTLNTWSWPEWMRCIHEAGGSVFSEDGTRVLLTEQPAIDTLARWAQQYEQSHVPKEYAVGSAAEAGGGLPDYWLEGRQIVYRARNAECEQHPEQNPAIDFVFGSPMQHEADDPPTSGNLNGGGYGITQLSENKEAAATLVIWLLQFENRGMWNTLKGNIPSGTLPLEHWEASSCVEEWVAAQTPYLFANQDSQTLWQESKTICAPQFQAACLGIKSVEEALEQAQEELTALLEESLQSA